MMPRGHRLFFDPVMADDEDCGAGVSCHGRHGLEKRNREQCGSQNQHDHKRAAEHMMARAILTQTVPIRFIVGHGLSPLLPIA